MNNAVKTLMINKVHQGSRISSNTLLGTYDLCYGCGTCAGSCPTNAIEMRLDDEYGVYLSKIIHERCNNCGLCTKVCPFPDLTTYRAKESKIKDLIGNIICCHIGYSTDKDIRINSSSGGLITSLLIFSLQKQIIDGATLVRMESKNPLKPEPFIAKTKEEIISAQGSKYAPVPLNVIIKTVLKEDGKFAVVGLPCHIRGIRNVMKMNKKLKDKIAFCLGLFCSRTVSLQGTRILLQKLRVKEEEVEELHYRGKGWPGKLQIRIKNGNSLECPYSEYWSLFGNFFFTPMGCLMCSDCTNVAADISCGDAWLPEVKKHDQLGSSIVISRTTIGDTLLEDAISRGVIELAEIKPFDVIRSQWASLYFKKVGLNRVRLLEYGTIKSILEIMRGSGIFGLNASLIPLINSRISSFSFLKSAIRIMPFSFLKLCGLLLSIIGFLWYRKVSRNAKFD